VRIEYAIPAKAVDSLADGTFVVLGVESNVRHMPDFPAPIRVPLFVCIVASPVEAQPGTPHHLTSRILDPGMEPTGDPLDLPFQIAPGPNTPVGWEVRTQIALLVAWQADGPGTFSIELAADGKTRGVPIIVS
jgi:hypothetical protein